MVFTNTRLLKAQELADALNKDVAQVYRLTREGEFDDFLVKIGAKPTYRYNPEGLEAYIKRGGRSQSAETGTA